MQICTRLSFLLFQKRVLVIALELPALILRGFDLSLSRHSIMVIQEKTSWNEERLLCQRALAGYHSGSRRNTPLL